MVWELPRENPEGEPGDRPEASFEAFTKEPEDLDKWTQRDGKTADDSIENEGKMVIGDHA